jgi:hypothetical protein
LPSIGRGWTGGWQAGRCVAWGVSCQRAEGGDIRGQNFPFCRRGQYAFADLGVLGWSIFPFSRPVGRGEEVDISRYKVGLALGVLIPSEPGAKAIVRFSIFCHGTTAGALSRLSSLSSIVALLLCCKWTGNFRRPSQLSSGEIRHCPRQRVALGLCRRGRCRLTVSWPHVPQASLPVVSDEVGSLKVSLHCCATWASTTCRTGRSGGQG